MRIEIFKNPYLCDDHFDKWTIQYPLGEGEGVIEKTADTIKITIPSGYSYAIGGRGSLSFNTEDYNVAAVRVVDFYGDYWRFVARKDSTEKISVYFYDTGLKIINLYDIYQGDIDEILLEVDGGEGHYLKVDYVAVCEGMLDPITDKKIISLEVNDCLLKKGVSNAIFNIVDQEDYSENLTNARVIIWIAEDPADLGRPDYKVFGGTINSISRFVDSDGHKRAEIECLGLGSQLQSPPKLINKVYYDMNGRDLIKDVIDESQVEISSLQVDPNELIASTFSKEYEKETPVKVINEICDESKTSTGEQGFDGWVHPSGTLYVIKRKSFTIGIGAIDESIIERAEYKRDFYRVRNKITVYGGWGSIGLATDIKKHGSYSIKVISGSENLAVVDRTVAPYTRIDGNPQRSLLSAEYLEFDVYIDHDDPDHPELNELNVYVETKIGNMSYQSVKIFTNVECNKWLHYKLKLGPEGDFSGNVKWRDIQKIIFHFKDYYQPFTAYLDGVHFSGTRYNKTVEDATSQSNYGLKTKIEIDDSLCSLTDCQLKAESLLSFLKDPVETLELTLQGKYLALKPGWQVPVSISQLNINDLFRIINFTHYVDESQNWKINVTLKNEPVYIDKIFRKLFNIS